MIASGAFLFLAWVAVSLLKLKAGEILEVELGTEERMQRAKFGTFTFFFKQQIRRISIISFLSFHLWRLILFHLGRAFKIRFLHLFDLAGSAESEGLHLHYLRSHPAGQFQSSAEKVSAI